jgi:ABC-type uncharacterized transport system YnjBCD ATPase subunit
MDLWGRIGTWTNLEIALAQALRGKRTRGDVQAFLRRPGRRFSRPSRARGKMASESGGSAARGSTTGYLLVVPSGTGKGP